MFLHIQVAAQQRVPVLGEEMKASPILSIILSLISVNFPSPDSPVASLRPRVRDRVRKPPHLRQVSRCLAEEDQEQGRSQETSQGARRRQEQVNRGAGQGLPPPSLPWLV